MFVAAIDAVAPELLGESIVYDNWQIAMRSDVSSASLRDALDEARQRFGPNLGGVVPLVDDRAVKQLKFSEMLPTGLARATLAERMADHDSIRTLGRQRVRQIR